MARLRPAARPKLKVTTALVPAAARAPEILTDIETELNVRAVEAFTAQLGGRDGLAGTLAVAEGDPAVEKVLTYLLDPRYERWSLRKICRLAGLTVVDLFTAYKRAVLAAAHIESTHIVARALPPIVADVMARATPRPVTCPTCQSGPKARPTCTRCQGTGLIASEPELERQKLALELGHLTEKKGGILMQQNTITAATAASLGSTAPGALEQLQQVVGDLLFSPRGRPRRDEPPAEPDPGDPDGGSGEVELPLPFEEHDRGEAPARREPWAPGDPEP